MVCWSAAFRILCDETLNLTPLIYTVQVTIQGVQLYDSVHWAVHILRSEAVAVMGVSIWGDPLVPLSRGIVIDGSRRVYLGGNVISTADDAISLKTTAGWRSLFCIKIH